MPGPMLRLVLCCVLFAGWLTLLLLGATAGGIVHLLLAAALLLFPWRSQP